MRRDEEEADETEIGPAVTRPPPPSEGGQHRPCLVVLRGTDTGQVFVLTSGETLVGRASGNAIRLRDGSVSRAHLRLLRKGARVRLEDLSSSGTSVNGRPVRDHELREGDKIGLGGGTELLFTYVDASSEGLEENLLAAAARDPLTGAWSRRQLISQLEHEIAYSQRHGDPLSFVIVIPTWREKRHEPESILNSVIVGVAERIRSALGQTELFARWSNDAFAIVSRGTGVAEVGSLGVSVSQAVTKTPIETELGPRSVSLRVLTIDSSAGEGSLRELIARADAALS